MTEVMKIVMQYCKDIKNEKIPSCTYTKKAINRFLSDMKKINDDGFDFTFNENVVQTFYDFSKFLKLPDMADEPLKLLPWQLFVFANLLGWVYKENPKKRRFREASIYVPRKNGKTSGLEIPLCIWDLITTPSAEVYIYAYTSSQAYKTYKEIQATLKKIPELQEYLELLSNATLYKEISRLAPMSPETNSDGYKPSLGIIDEYHCLPSEKPVLAMRYGGRARLNSLTMIITTAGTDTSLPAYEQQQKMFKVLDGIYDDPYSFYLFYGADESDDWTKSETYVKANPSIDSFLDRTLLEQDLQDSINNPVRKNEYLAKTLNRWTTGESSWINIDTWQKNKDLKIEIEKYKHSTFFAGVDFSESGDWTALTFYTFDDDLKKYMAFHKFYIPEETVKIKYKTENINLYKWLEDGIVTQTTGATIDYDFIVKDFLEFASEYNVAELYYDPWHSKEIIDKLENENGSCVYVPFSQALKTISPVAKEFEKEIIDGNIVDNNPVMFWFIGNVIVKPDVNGNIKPMKKYKSSTAKIDGVISSIMAFSGCHNSRKTKTEQPRFQDFETFLEYF